MNTDLRKLIDLVENINKSVSLQDLQHQANQTTLSAISIEWISRKGMNEFLEPDDGDDDDDDWGLDKRLIINMVFDAKGFSILHPIKKRPIPLESFFVAIGAERRDGQIQPIWKIGYDAWSLSFNRDETEMQEEDHEGIYWWMYEDDPRTKQLYNAYYECTNSSSRIDQVSPNSDGDPIILICSNFSNLFKTICNATSPLTGPGENLNAPLYQFAKNYPRAQ